MAYAAPAFSQSASKLTCVCSIPQRQNYLKFSCFQKSSRGSLKACASEEGKNEWTKKDGIMEFLRDEIDEATESIIDTAAAQGRLKSLEAAIERVKAAQTALENFDEQQVLKRGSLQSTVINEELTKLQQSAKFNIIANEKRVSTAEEEVQRLEEELNCVQAKLGIRSEGFSEKWDGGNVDEVAEKVESIKAAIIGGATAGAVSLPFVLIKAGDSFSSEALLSSAFFVSSGVLFSITYRYIVRRDLGNTELKSGAIGAFSLIRAFAQVEDTFSSANGTPWLWSWDTWAPTFGNVSETVLVFAFIALLVEFCMREGIISPFPSKKN